jgi:Uma2 family endonuclease
MSTPETTFVTEEEFLALPESTNKVELLDGEVIVPPAPTFEHQKLLRRLVAALERWEEASSIAVEICQATLDVRFGAGRILQPDAFVLFGRVPLDHQGPIDQIPALCVEVISGDRAYDRVTKRAIYANAGVQEYWTVHPGGLIERWTGPDLMTREEVRETLTTPLLPGFTLDLAQLYQR